MQLLKQNEFLKKYNIDIEQFIATKFTWRQLNDIYCDYNNVKNDLENTAKLFYEILIKATNVNSVKFRLKNAEHLIEKIIRKKIKKPKTEINIENYRTRITDLIGIRALHIFKEDWLEIHNFIRNKWKQKNMPEAYIRKGDNEDFIKVLKENECRVKIHPYGYRSVHYTVKSNPTAKLEIAEIQVRTIFEEGWSEVDHQVRYPYDIKNPLLVQYLYIMNNITNSADLMSSYIKKLKKIEIDYNENIKNLQEKVKSFTNKDKRRLKKDFQKFYDIDKENIYIPNKIQPIIIK